MKKIILKFISLKSITAFLVLLCFASCSSDDDDTSTDDMTTDDDIVLDVDASFFNTDDGSVTITRIPCTLSDGTETECYQIVTNSMAGDHEMGPWCPETITDGAEAGGIWLDGGEVHEVDGAFIENLATFYNDNTWLMHDENGDIFITETEEDCIAAANPNVGDAFQNFCVECIPSYITDLSQTWVIPVTPVFQETPTTFATGPGGGNTPSTRGIALNGDAGGHINVNQGYHYHAATGFSTEIAQEDGHAALIGYALDGYGIYEYLDADGNPPTGLDELRGQTDDVRGYHYHVDEAGNNNFINGLRGAYAN